MNSIEVFHIEDEYEIEKTVNDYCKRYNIKPISVSIAYSPRKDLWVVAVVVDLSGFAW